MDGETPAPRRPIRVLLVDDEVRVRRALREILRVQPDIEVVGEASSGDEAIALAEEKDPDVVLMDCRMATMNGVTATRTIKEPRDPPRVVVLTMHPDTEAEARQAGADEFLLKGCPNDVLLKALGSGSRAHKSSRRTLSPLSADTRAGIRREP